MKEGIKLARIIKCEGEILEKIPNIMGHIYEYFKEKPLVVYAALDDNKQIGFIAKDFDNGIYLKTASRDYDIIPFRLNEDGTLGVFKIGDNTIFKDSLEIQKAKLMEKKDSTNDVFMIDGQGIQYCLGIRKLDNEDVDGYNGMVFLLQYNPQTDVLCDIKYQQMYYENGGKNFIYDSHTNIINVLSIEENYCKCQKRRGFLGPNIKYYTKYEFGNGMLGYVLSTIKDYGFVKTMRNGSYDLQKSDRIVRYVKSAYLCKDGSYCDLWPFAMQKTTDEINKVIEEYGFKNQIPDILMNVYNDYDQVSCELHDLIEQIKNIELGEDNEMSVHLQLVIESMTEDN